MQLKPEDISINMSYDHSLLISIINELNTLLPDRVINPDYYINDDNYLIITSGKDGVVVKEDNFKNEIVALLNDVENDEPKNGTCNGMWEKWHGEWKHYSQTSV